MTPVGVQRIRPVRAGSRRWPGGAGRFVTEATPRLFPDADGGTAPAEGRTPELEPVEERVVPEPLERMVGSEPADGRGEEATLEAFIRGLWDELLVEGSAACPLCGGELEGRASAHARPTEGRCRDCGTTIG